VALAGAGAAVAAVARTAWELAETAAAVERVGGRVVTLTADVTNGAAVAEALARAEGELGPIDLLVNNAGAPGPLGPLADTEPATWWRCIEVNLGGPMLCTRLVLPGMLERRRGRIINLASGAGTRGIPYMSAYVTSKTALIRFTEVVAAEVAASGVRVFAIGPGAVRTATTLYALESPEGRRWMPWLRTIFDEQREATPEHAAELALLVASGRVDALSGRLLERPDDLTALLDDADRIVRRDLYVLRLRSDE
jgi:NAD(P)-dependent dehydrogenase (short-subunit alcohol dehydrogenase family)